MLPKTILPFQQTKATKATKTKKKGLKETKSSHFRCHAISKMSWISSIKPTKDIKKTYVVSIAIQHNGTLGEGHTMRLPTMDMKPRCTQLSHRNSISQQKNS